MLCVLCREAGSMDVELKVLREVLGALSQAVNLSTRPDLYEPLRVGTGLVTERTHCVGIPLASRHP